MFFLLQLPLAPGRWQGAGKLHGGLGTLRRCSSDSLLCHTPADITGAPAEDSAAAAAAAAAAEAGAVLTVQRCGAYTAHVCLCAPCPLDGLRLVCHRAPGDGSQRRTALGHR